MVSKIENVMAESEINLINDYLIPLLQQQKVLELKISLADSLIDLKTDYLIHFDNKNVLNLPISLIFILLHNCTN